MTKRDDLIQLYLPYVLNQHLRSSTVEALKRWNMTILQLPAREGRPASIILHPYSNIA